MLLVVFQEASTVQLCVSVLQPMTHRVIRPDVCPGLGRPTCSLFIIALAAASVAIVSCRKGLGSIGVLASHRP